MEIKKKKKEQNQLELKDSPLKWISVLENWLEDLPQALW